LKLISQFGVQTLFGSIFCSFEFALHRFLACTSEPALIGRTS
jgi:hypothetical protein